MLSVVLRAAVAGLVLLAGCSGSSGAFTTPVAGAEKMTLWEGLPHQMFEHDLMESERRSKPVQELHGHWFYKEPLAPSAEANAAGDEIALQHLTHAFASEHGVDTYA